MFKIDLKSKRLEEVKETTLKEKDLWEREDLQQWIKSNVEVINRHFETDIKIIAEEFDEFEHSERIDLLAVDSSGALVVIELKRLDSGSKIDFQVLKYASYCSTLTPQRIVEIYEDYLKKNHIMLDAREDLSQFISSDPSGGDSDLSNLNSEQRIILIAQNFDPKIKSVVAWLGGREIDISCIEFKLFIDEKSNCHYLDTQKILPLEEIGDFLIKDSTIGIDKTLRSSKKLVPQSKEVLTFLEEYKKFAKQKYNLHARGVNHVKYRTFKAGIGSVEFAFEVMKSDKRYKINLMGQDPTIKLLNAFESVKNKIKPPSGYKFQFVDPKTSDAKWERILIFVDPENPQDYLNDAEKMADLTKDFIDSLAPVIEKLKAA